MKKELEAVQEKSPVISWFYLGLLSCFTVLGLAVQPSFQTVGDLWLSSLLGVFSIDPVLHLLLFVGLCSFYHGALSYIRTGLWSKRDRACVVVPAALFAAFMVVGRSFADTASLDLVLGNSLQLIKSLLMWNGYFILFSITIAGVFTWLPSVKLWQKKEGRRLFQYGLLGKYQQYWEAHPFLTPFITMLVLYFPYIVVSYPGIIMGDTPNLILQGFNLSDSTSKYLNLIDESVRLNGHHPIIYTLFLHACLVLGNNLFHSYSIGVFLAAMIQLLAQLAAMSAMLSQLTRLQLRIECRVGLMAFFALAPRSQNYAFLLTKDVLALCALLLFLLYAFQLLNEEKVHAKSAICCAFAGIALCLLRNEGQYVILGSIVIMPLIAPKKCRKLILPVAVSVLVAILFFHVLMPAAHITPGSKREILSVPFQQTARYLRDYPDLEKCMLQNNRIQLKPPTGKQLPPQN